MVESILLFDDKPLVIITIDIYKNENGWYCQVDNKTLQLTDDPNDELTYGFLTRIRMTQTFDEKNIPIELLSLTLDEPPEQLQYQIFAPTSINPYPIKKKKKIKIYTKFFHQLLYIFGQLKTRIFIPNFVTYFYKF